MGAPWELGPTPSIEEYLEAEREDPNLWWRIGCGHHQNLFEAAIQRLDDEGLLDDES